LLFDLCGDVAVFGQQVAGGRLPFVAQPLEDFVGRAASEFGRFAVELGRDRGDEAPALGQQLRRARVGAHALAQEEFEIRATHREPVRRAGRDFLQASRIRAESVGRAGEKPTGPGG